MEETVNTDLTADKVETQKQLEKGNDAKNMVAPHDKETEANLLNFLEKQQGKKQSIQSIIDYIPEELFYDKEHQTRYEFVLGQHKQERRKDIPQQQAYWLSDLIDLKKKRDLLRLVQECEAKIFTNKQSFKIIKSRLVAQIEAI
tara:strand:+ start:434 stop:865 length:432 start_codon:yes stop_codon:yes gene_type:complete